MLPSLAAVLVVGLARLVIWFIARRSHRFTTGMLLITGATILFIPYIGEDVIDPFAEVVGGASFGDLVQHLFVVLGLYELSAGMIHEDGEFPPDRRLWALRAVTAAALCALIMTYVCGKQSRVPAEEFALMDRWGFAHAWTLIAYMTTAFVIIFAVTVANVSAPGIDLQRAMASMFVVAGIGLIMCIIVAALLILAPDYLRQGGYQAIATGAALPALAALGVAGWPGLMAAWDQRHE